MQHIAKNSYFCMKFLRNEKIAGMATVLITVALVGVAVLLLGVKIFFVKGGRFPNTHIHGNAEMRRRGITCARDSGFYK